MQTQVLSWRIAVFAVVLALIFTNKIAHAETIVDLELVLAVDVSHSMDAAEQRLQRSGYVAAFRHRDIIRAIETGPNGRIAVAYLEWGEQSFQALVIPWRIIASASDAKAFANELERRRITVAKQTSISGALTTATTLILKNDIKSLRQVIDVSGDGPNNSGYPVTAARDATLRQGIVINGLPFVIDRPDDISSFFAVPDIDRYYTECVIGGPGAFTMRVSNKDEFETAIRRKLLLEIAGAQPPGRPLVHKAQFRTTRSNYDCLVGEKKWDSFQLE